MRKKMLIIITIVVCILIVGIIILKMLNSNQYANNTTQQLIKKNISGQYSELKVTDFDSAKDSLKEIVSELNINSIENELKEDTIDTSGNYINTYKFGQLYKGIEVFNGGLTIYTNKDGITKGIINYIKEINNLDIIPQSELNDLENIIKSEYKDLYKSIDGYDLVIYQLESGEFKLAHKYNVYLNNELIDNETVIIEDATNEILYKSNVIYELEKNDYNYFLVDGKYDLADLQRNIFLVKQNSEIINNKNGVNTETYSWNQNEEISNESELLTQAICTTQKCYDYYESKFNYKLDKENKNHNNIILVTNIKEYYGDNISDTIISLPSSLKIIIGANNKYNNDVECIAHEFTHCIFYNKTMNGGNNTLENEALNEAYADIMGMCIEAYYKGDTKIDGFINTTYGRDIKNSQAKYQDLNKLIKKDKYYYSTIISKTAYLMNQKLSLNKVEELWFESMKLLGKNADFVDCYYAVIETAKNIGLTDNEIRIVKEAFSEVGIESEILDEMLITIDKLWNNGINKPIANSNNKIVGEWKATETNNDEYSMGWLYGSALTLANELKFEENGTYSFGLGVTYAQEGKYVIEGNKIKLIETEYKGDNPDKKIAQELTINNEQIILVETEDDQKINVIFNNINNIKKDADSNVTNTDNENTTNSTEFTEGELKIGNKTIKYGIYEGIYGATGDVLVIKSDNTATLNGTNYTYKVGKYNFAQDSSSDSYKDAIIFLTNTGDTSFALYVSDNGSLNDDPMCYVYKDN